MVPTETAPIGQINPMESLLEDVSDTYASEINRRAMGTVRGGHILQYRNSDRGVRFSWAFQKSPFGGSHHELAVVAAIGAARLPGGCNLFRRPDVGLRQFNLFFCAGNLALMALGKSLVHIFRIHPGLSSRHYQSVRIVKACCQSSLKNPGRHRRMHSGSMARAAMIPPQS